MTTITVEQAYEKGWIAAARWTNRDDLIADIGSAAYTNDRDSALSAPATAPEPVMTINSNQITQLAQFACAGDALDEPTDICVQRKPAGKDTDGEDAPAGLYAWLAEYPEEGMLFLDPDEASAAPATAPEPVAWMFDWYAEPGDGGDGLIRDWLTTSYDEAHSPTMGCHNIRPLYLRDDA